MFNISYYEIYERSDWFGVDCVEGVDGEYGIEGHGLEGGELLALFVSGIEFTLDVVLAVVPVDLAAFAHFFYACLDLHLKPILK